MLPRASSARRGGSSQGVAALGAVRPVTIRAGPPTVHRCAHRAAHSRSGQRPWPHVVHLSWLAGHQAGRGSTVGPVTTVLLAAIALVAVMFLVVVAALA